MAAGKKTGGRKKGSRNKAVGKVKALRAAIDISGLTPLEYMLGVLRDPKVDHERRDRMAGMAAPYVHAKLTTISGDPKAPINVIHKVERVIVRIENKDGGGI